ncbi:hypothetical protein GQ43DRAFT_494744, partial [Delitschia confertaspora ATCC 74209]
LKITHIAALIFSLYFLSFLRNGNAHSWVERAYFVSNNTIVGQPGFPRGNVLRTSPSFTDKAMTYLLPPNGHTTNTFLPSDPFCKETQRSANQTSGSPVLSAHVNDTILLLYQENGHVTKLDEDPRHITSGVIRVYGTSNSSPTDTLQGINEWGFDKFIQSKGDYGLMLWASFDDGDCYQDNNTPKALERKTLVQRAHLEVEGNDLWCGWRVRLPAISP